MSLFNMILIILPLYCITDGIIMLVKGSYNPKQLERYAKYTPESVQASVKPNAIIYICLGIVFTAWNIIDLGSVEVPLWIEIALIALIFVIIIATVILNRKILVEKPGYIGNIKKKL